MSSIGMPLGKKSPKSELHEFYQLHPGTPVFSVKGLSMAPAEPLFECNLTVPAIGGANGLPEQAFAAQGRNKKIAEHYAAEKALEFLRRKGLIAPALTAMEQQQLPSDLQKQLEGITTDSALEQLQAQVMANKHNRALLDGQPLPQEAPVSPPPSDTNGVANGALSSATNDAEAAVDWDNLDRDALIAQLRQASRENSRLKAEIEAYHNSRQAAIDMLLGAK